MKRRVLASALPLLWLLVTSQTNAKGTCPPGFKLVPMSKVGCVQSDCLDVGGTYGLDLRCACRGSKTCTEPVRYTRRARARCKKPCPEQQIVACVPEGQPCPKERQIACKEDSDCPSCTYCKAGQCEQASALITTSVPPNKSKRRRKRTRRRGWNATRVAFWPNKWWIARFFWSQGCKTKFKNVEGPEMLATLLSSNEVKALAHFGHCVKSELVKIGRPKGRTFVSSKTPKTRYKPTAEGWTAAELRDEVVELTQKLLSAKFRRLGMTRRKAKKKAAEEARRATENGWLHFFLNGTCHSLDDNSMPDAFVRPGGIYWGTRGTRQLGIPLIRYQKPK
jgi:hypothetical protein